MLGRISPVLYLWVITECLPFICCCALLRVKMESVYICSVFIWGRHNGFVECLSYWHTCCVSSGLPGTQCSGSDSSFSRALCRCFCYLLTVQCDHVFVIWWSEFWKVNCCNLLKVSSNTFCPLASTAASPALNVFAFVLQLDLSCESMFKPIVALAVLPVLVSNDGSYCPAYHLL